MKTLFFMLFALSLTCVNSLNCFPLPVFEKYSSKDSLLFDTEESIYDFYEFMKAKGHTPPDLPTAKISTTPALIFWDNNYVQVVLPIWDELNPGQKQLFETWMGDKAEEFFVSMFNWFFIPHELGHFMLLTNPENDSLTPCEKERAANQFAVAFLINKDENLEKINYIKSTLEKILSLLPKINFNGMDEDAYFNRYYSDLGTNPNAYGYFQFKFILDILENMENLNIVAYLDKEY